MYFNNSTPPTTFVIFIHNHHPYIHETPLPSPDLQPLKQNQTTFRIHNQISTQITTKEEIHPKLTTFNPKITPNPHFDSKIKDGVQNGGVDDGNIMEVQRW